MKNESVELKLEIDALLKQGLSDGGVELLNLLGYWSNKTLDLPDEPQQFWNAVAPQFSSEKALINDWVKARFLFQLTNDEIPGLGKDKGSLSSSTNYQYGQIESFVFLNIVLRPRDWKRSELAEITREVNRVFPMPAIILFVHGDFASLAVIDRRVNKRDSNRDVLATKIAVIKDVYMHEPHRAHLEILHDLAIQNVGKRHQPGNFRDLYDAWIKILDIKELNNRFYSELYNWYNWAITESVFPKGQEWDPHQISSQRSVAVIRLLTRLLFVWFIKEKGLVPDDLFNPRKLQTLLTNPDLESPTSSSYYRAILQNLFFATLNTEQAERRWMSESSQSSHRLIHSVFRYRDQFRNPDVALNLFREIPFLNGGIFECLDREVTEQDLKRDPNLKQKCVHEGSGLVLRIDGFSVQKENPIHVPNRLFFGKEKAAVLGADSHSKKGPLAIGLIEIFSQYKFTVEENTPTEEEVALDPELLGKVFENLLASYNPDTTVSARKLSGSFYTPREVVEFMVNEALIAHLDSVVPNSTERLRDLLSYKVTGNLFDSAETKQLVKAIDGLRVLDPAVGSGAFPMGMLQKLVHVLKKLDPDNAQWLRQNREPLERQLLEAESIPDPTLRESKFEEAEEELKKLDLAFSKGKYADYARKLYLIEKSLFGVDCQPIAITIAKLRFFISLAIEQDFNPALPNGNITPLPNLETKLVTANSLVRVRSGQLTLRSLEVDQKESEIKQATIRYFAARTTKTKRKYRERVTILRQELADQLVSDGILAKTDADRIVSWDQFDQNASATFFDPEWMFGLNDGFDIVIGNPPYAVLSKTEFDKQYENFDLMSGKPDLYRAFLEWSLVYNKSETINSYIVPNTFLTMPSAAKLRNGLLKRAWLQYIVNLESPVFDAAVNNVIIQWRNLEQKEPHYRTRITNASMSSDLFASDKSVIVSEEELTKNGGLGWNTSAFNEEAELLNQIQVSSSTLQSYCCQIVLGSQEYHNTLHTPEEIASRYLHSKVLTKASQKPALNGRDIGEIILSNIHPREFVDYGSDRIYNSLPARATCGPRTIVREITSQRLVASWTSLDFVVNKSCYVVIPTSQNLDHQLALTIVLASKIIGFWVSMKGQKAKQALFPRLSMQTLKNLPISLNNPADVSCLAQYGRAMAAVVKLPNGQQPNLQLDQLLNGLVYELYFPRELHSAGITLFDEVRRRLFLSKDSTDSDFPHAALKEAEEIFRNNHPIYRMLFDLQAVPVVRIIEGEARY